jgi:transposase
MGRPVLIDEGTLADAIVLRDETNNARDLKRALTIILLADKDNSYTASQVGNLLGISRDTVFNNINSFKKDQNIDIDDYEKKSWGGRRHALMSFEEETSFLNEWETKALAGEILTIPELRDKLSARLHHNISKGTIYSILKRHNWRKVKPDTKHPKSDPIIQEEFKKNSRYSWKKFL